LESLTASYPIIEAVGSEMPRAASPAAAASAWLSVVKH